MEEDNYKLDKESVVNKKSWLWDYQKIIIFTYHIVERDKKLIMEVVDNFIIRVDSNSIVEVDIKVINLNDTVIMIKHYMNQND